MIIKKFPSAVKPAKDPPQLKLHHDTTPKSPITLYTKDCKNITQKQNTQDSANTEDAAWKTKTIGQNKIASKAIVVTLSSRQPFDLQILPSVSSFIDRKTGMGYLEPVIHQLPTSIVTPQFTTPASQTLQTNIQPTTPVASNLGQPRHAKPAVQHKSSSSINPTAHSLLKTALAESSFGQPKHAQRIAKPALKHKPLSSIHPRAHSLLKTALVASTYVAHKTPTTVTAPITTMVSMPTVTAATTTTTTTTTTSHPSKVPPTVKSTTFHGIKVVDRLTSEADVELDYLPFISDGATVADFENQNANPTKAGLKSRSESKEGMYS